MSITTEKREQRFRKYYKEHATGKGRIYTPKVVRDKMIKYVKKDDKILVLYNIEFVVDFLLVGIKPSNILFVSDDNKRCHLVEDMEVKAIHIENHKQIKEKLENMKFDLIISNPPYNRGLDLKILNEIYTYSSKICFIHPTTWLYDNKNLTNLFLKTKELVKQDFINFKIITDDTKIYSSYEIFKIGTFVPIAITLFDKTRKSKIDVYSFDMHGNSEIYIKLKKKILDYCKKTNVQDKISFKKHSKFIFGFPKIRGHNGTNDFYTSVQLTDETKHIGEKTHYELVLNFDSEDESLNFKDYMKTKFARFCLSIYKINANIQNKEPRSVPYLPTYTKSWTDEQAAQEVGLTDEELQFMLNWIPNYYPEDKEIYGPNKQ